MLFSRDSVTEMFLYDSHTIRPSMSLSKCKVNSGISIHLFPIKLHGVLHNYFSTMTYFPFTF
jgi:hypothetical protein